MSFTQQLFITVTDKLLIAIIVLFAVFLINKNLEKFKILENKRAAAVTAKINTIDMQLADFYWPITFRLEKDNAVWTKLLDSEKNLADRIEFEVILPNHREILKIIDLHSDLIFNTWEPVSNEFIALIKTYERHITVYFALRSINDRRMPIDVNEPWPEKLYPMFLTRIEQLQKHRRELMSSEI